MTRRCFFVQRIDPYAECVNLSPQASHHLEHVLRLKAGDRIEIRDGLGNAWQGEISELNKGNVAVRLLGEREFSVLESPVDVTLALGLARSDIMDLVVRQATETGVSRVIAFRAARSQYGLSGRQAEKKLQRWSKIAAEAMCQCGRSRLPEIVVFENLDEFLRQLPERGVGGETLKLFARERESNRDLGSLRESWPECARILATIGPEGGWDDSEVLRLINAGFESVHLGPRLLRFETAAIGLISSIQLLWGDWGGTQEKEGDKDEMH
jgi:16S rRNA (uracil1498-N3)-methyltransferase